MSKESSISENNIKIENSRLVYKPPGHDNYVDLVEYLNAVDQAIKEINNNIIALNNFVK